MQVKHIARIRFAPGRLLHEQRQHDSTSRMMFPFDALLAYISTFMLLKPGDLIATGTPTGAGARFDPPKWLVPGDTVEGLSATDYLRQSILEPDAYVVDGWPAGQMLPVYGDRLTENQIESLVEYLLTLEADR